LEQNAQFHQAVIDASALSRHIDDSVEKRIYRSAHTMAVKGQALAFVLAPEQRI
jgi:hypothetical protein